MLKHSIICLAVGIVWGVTGVCVVLCLPLRFNATDSVPLGLYRTVADSGAPYAGLCLSDETLAPALRAGLDIGPGDCPNGRAPILKPLVKASKERPIMFGQSGFQIDGRWLPNTQPKSTSKAGAPLSHAPFGVYTDGWFAISSHNPNSWDSRYFGKVDERAIRFRAVPVLTL